MIIKIFTYPRGAREHARTFARRLTVGFYILSRSGEARAKFSLRNSGRVYSGGRAVMSSATLAHYAAARVTPRRYGENGIQNGVPRNSPLYSVTFLSPVGDRSGLKRNFSPKPGNRLGCSRATPRVKST